MGRTKCNISSYDPSPKYYNDDYIEPQNIPRHHRQYDDYVIEPDITQQQRGTQRAPQTNYASMELDSYLDVEKFKRFATLQQLRQERNNKNKKLKYDQYEPSTDGSLSDEVYIVSNL